ncbi:MAG: sulfotransferase, partial [Nocardioides sp.]|nr:sulfotransferase [Nocardioides sp.]
MTGVVGPDFIVIGAPKAGTTALHVALTQHPEVRMSQPKEPKYWLCDDAPPPAYGGPGDAHSQQEWLWRREDYERLFADPVEGVVQGESTPFYLW